MFKTIRKAVKKMSDNIVELAKIKKDCYVETLNRLENMEGDTLIVLGIGIGITLITLGILKNRRNVL